MALSRIALLLALSAPAAAAQSAFVMVSAARNDTIQVESFTRTPAGLEAELLSKGAPRQVFSSAIGADGRMGALTLALYPAGSAAGAQPMMTAKVAFAGDTAVAEMARQGSPPATQRIPSRAVAQPLMSTSVAQLQVMLDAARRGTATTATATVFLVTGGMTLDVGFSNLRSDSITATFGPTVWWLRVDAAGRIMRGGLPSQGLIVTRVDGAAAGTLGREKPDYAAPAGAPYTAAQLAIPTPMGHTLGATFTRPAGATKPSAVVVSISGSGAQDRDGYISIVPGGYRLFRQVADTLGRRGIAMLRFDDRGTGESGGSFVTATSRDFADDARAVIAYLRTRPDVDSRRIFLLGHSEGGMIAPMIAADDRALAGIVLMAGTGRKGREILEFQFGQQVAGDPSLPATTRAAQRARVPAMVDSLVASSAWMQFFAGYDPIPTARRVTVPVLILQGADDQQVIADEALMLERAFLAGGNRSVTTEILPELNHLFIRQPGGAPSGYATLKSNRAESQVMGMVADWISERAR